MACVIIPINWQILCFKCTWLEKWKRGSWQLNDYTSSLQRSPPSQSKLIIITEKKGMRLDCYAKAALFFTPLLNSITSHSLSLNWLDRVGEEKGNLFRKGMNVKKIHLLSGKHPLLMMIKIVIMLFQPLNCGLFGV